MIKAVIFDMYETLITHYNSPLYFGEQMAKDLGLTKEQFYPLWRATDHERTIGQITFEQIIHEICKQNHITDENKIEYVINQRKALKRELFNHLHPEIIPMLEMLKKNDIKIGLISNCFSEESEIIKESILYPYFDVVFLSSDCGLRKPDLEIFNACIEALHVESNECLYIGDGGSNELYSALEVGMKPIQAGYYHYTKDSNFDLLNHPLKIKEYVEKAR